MVHAFPHSKCCYLRLGYVCPSRLVKRLIILIAIIRRYTCPMFKLHQTLTCCIKTCFWCSNALQKINSKCYSSQKTFILFNLTQSSFIIKRLFNLTCVQKTIQLNLEDKSIQKYIRNTIGEFNGIMQQLNAGMNDAPNVDHKELNRRLVILQPVAECIELLEKKKEEIHELERILQDKVVDPELIKMAKEDKIVGLNDLAELEKQLFNVLLPTNNEDFDNIILEVTAGVGGQEAMLFAKELFNMYVSYAGWKGWQFSIIESQATGLDGLRHASLSIAGAGAYSHLKFESGVHRVQRVPKTEKSGRIHTSTVAVAILPQPCDIEINLNPGDIQMDTKRSSGAGGQHVNKTESAVRLTHLPTGTVVECQTSRSQIENRALALKKLQAKLYQQQYEEQLMLQQSTRKIQIGTSGRSEKIRTYHFNQNRITDHRLDENFHDLLGFLSGSNGFNQLIQALNKELQKEMLIEVITNALENKN